jgi:preprotein translocase subunit SecA
MFKKIAKAIGRDPQKREIERLSERIQEINHLETEYEKLSDEQLRAKTDFFRNRLASGETLDNLLNEAFAVVREASKRTIGLRPYNIQLIGGIVLHEGMIAEMRTGEGKTLVATLPLYLNALAGKGVHLVTVNDYLARRDARWMAPIYHLLGMSVGVLQMSQRTNNARSAFIIDTNIRSIREEDDQLQLVPRNEAYLADITYGTNNEFGFDYLRDNLIMDIKNRVQRAHSYAIIDEVDNILIDEARTPLIISGPASEDVEWYSRMAVIVKQLDPEDYDFNEKDRSIALTEIGEIHVEELLQIPLKDPDRPEDITPEQARLLGYLEQALRAELLFKKNKDYIIQNNEIVIVDEFTGRLMPGRRWSEGLHQAVEAKEGVKVNPENITHATITLQNYFRKYEKLSGMTGTALTEAEEFSAIYGLDVLEIPTNLDFEASQIDTPINILQAKDDEGYTYTYYVEKDDPDSKPIYWKRKDYPDVVYRTEEAKLRAICLEIIEFQLLGRPQLVGTTSIEHSERLSLRLQPDLLKRLLTVILIRKKWMQKNNVEILEQVVPELEPLNQPLPQLNFSDFRQLSQKLGIQSISLESDENMQTLLDFFYLPLEHRGKLLKIVQAGIQHQVLNALRHDQESQIIENAGSLGAVTIATNMAGRGVDIKLGGEIQESILSDVRKYLNQNGIDPYGMTANEMAVSLEDLNPPSDENLVESIKVFLSFLEQMRLVRESGGLHVIGSERHEARRIDNQLRGRSGRQGDPGSSRFYLSLEDDLMRMFGGERAENMMRFFNLEPSIPLESKLIGRLVEQAQERVEGSNFDIRKHLLDYDDILNDQRERIYSERDRVLLKKQLDEDVWSMLEKGIQDRISLVSSTPDGLWKLLAFLDEIQPTIFYHQQNQHISSFVFEQIAGLTRDLTKGHSDADSIKSALLTVAEKALSAEKEHLIVQTRDFIQRSAVSFQNQFDERIDLLDIFLDAIESRDRQSLREINSQLQNTIRVKIQLNSTQVASLIQQDDSERKALINQIKIALKRTFLSRVILTVEHRITEKLGINLDDVLESDWTSIENQIIGIIGKRFNTRAEKIAQPANPINQNIDKLVKTQIDDPEKGINFIELLSGMAFGNRVAINQQTHKKIYQRVNILNYVFLAASMLEGVDVQTLSEKILKHLKFSQNKLQFIWGNMEMTRFIDSKLEYQSLSDDYKQDIEDNLEKSEIEKLHAQPLNILIADNEIVNTFGNKVQQIIYRHILLQSISELWIDHLTRMEALRISIRMEAYAQRDPLVQYKSYSSDTFKDLLTNIRQAVISKMFRLQPSESKTKSLQLQKEETSSKNKKQKQSSGKKSRKRHKKK